VDEPLLDTTSFAIEGSTIIPVSRFFLRKKVKHGHFVMG
jgi:hypothetical protein